MTEKIYLETSEKCPGSVYFPLLIKYKNTCTEQIFKSFS